MTTPNDPDVQLAVRAAEWCGWPRNTPYSWWHTPLGINRSATDAGLLAMDNGNAHLLVALLAKCVALPDVTTSIDTASGCYSAYVYVDGQELEWREDTSPLIALLRALDAAGVLP